MKEIIIITSTYSPRTKHSPTFYLATAQALVEGIQLGLTDRELAEYLNDKELLSPAGAPWTAGGISKALWKLRNWQSISSTLHIQLLQLIFSGVITVADTLPLYEPRKHPRMVM